MQHCDAHTVCCLCVIVQLWMSFSTIADSTAKYFDVDQMQVNWLSIVFMVATIVVGIGAMWILDHCGLRATVMLILKFCVLQTRMSSTVSCWWGI